MSTNKKHTSIDNVSLYSEACGSKFKGFIPLIVEAIASVVWWPEGVCRQFAELVRYVIHYHHPGTGRSINYEPGKSCYTVEALSDDSVNILDVYGIDSALRTHVV